MKIGLSTQKAFTLIELMVVVVIVAIFAAIAIPSYQQYVRRANAAQAQQEIQRIASELERWKSRNFNYLGFSAIPDPLVLPVNATGSSIRYRITVRDGDNTSQTLTDNSAIGRNWVIRAESQDPKNYTFLINNLGLRCKNKTAVIVTFIGCGTQATGREEW